MKEIVLINTEVHMLSEYVPEFQCVMECWCRVFNLMVHLDGHSVVSVCVRECIHMYNISTFLKSKKGL